MRCMKNWRYIALHTALRRRCFIFLLQRYALQRLTGNEPVVGS